jgi:hypothetical protein
LWFIPVFQSGLKTNSQPLIDLLRLPLIGRLLHWRHARTLLQIPLFIVSAAMILHGLFGPTLAPKNLATTLTWVHFRGALVFVLLFACREHHQIRRRHAGRDCRFKQHGVSGKRLWSFAYHECRWQLYLHARH